MAQSETTLKTDIETERLIGHVKGKLEGGTFVIFGGIHGNEPSGVTALEEVLEDLSALTDKLRGEVYGIRGNIPALKKERRFLSHDLNRIWSGERIVHIKEKTAATRSEEENELLELHQLLNDILDTATPPFYFVDFHTTSSPTLPFITINDAMINRKFARQFPVPIILGMEEYLEGPLLSYINEKGYLAVGFESGQHYTEEAVLNSIAFAWLALEFGGFLQNGDVPRAQDHLSRLKDSAKGNTSFYEITLRHVITAEDDFVMVPGFNSFESVKAGSTLARHNEKTLRTNSEAIIFMPLYQEQGEEGYFLIRKIPNWVLRLSAAFRKLRLDRFLVLLPGVNWANSDRKQLMVNLKVARFFSKPFFHLLGYRNRRVDDTHIAMNSRERAARNEMYRQTGWYR